MIYFFLLVNKSGQKRLSKYYKHFENEKRQMLEAEVARKCLHRGDNQCCFVNYKDIQLVYRRYGALVFILGVDESENEMAMFEFIQCLVEMLNDYFDRVSEIDLMFNLDKVHLILDEMIMNGQIAETNKTRVFAPLRLLEGTKR